MLTFEESRQYLRYRLPPQVSHRVRLSPHSLPGFEVKGDGMILLDRGIWDHELASNAITLATDLGMAFSDPVPGRLAAGSGGGRLSGASEGVTHLEPTEADLQEINANHAIRPLEAEDVEIYERYIVNNQPARNRLWFTDRALDKLVQDYNQGRSRLFNHDQAVILGRTYSAEKVSKQIRGIDGDWVKVREFVTLGAGNDNHIKQINAGVYAFDSIGFAGGVLNLRELEREGETYTFLEIDYDPSEQVELEGYEVSYVYIGAMRGAGNDRQKNSGTTARENSGLESTRDTGAVEESGADNQSTDEVETWLSVS